jgi:hypothetical protein
MACIGFSKISKKKYKNIYIFFFEDDDDDNNNNFLFK